jgi:hypothetical protein
MKERITVQEAIAAGKKQTLLPRLLLFIGLSLFAAPAALLAIVIANYSSRSQTIAFILAGISVAVFLLLVMLPLRTWSNRIHKWQVWAFTHCSDLHELRRQAKFSALYFEEGTLLGRLLRPASEPIREQLTALRQEFDNPEHFVDDSAIPAVTVIRLSRTKLIANFIFNLFGIFLGGIVLLYAPAEAGIWARLLGGILVAAMLYTLLTGAWNHFVRSPCIILSDKGIETVGSGFKDWGNIENERIEQHKRGKGAISYNLRYDYPAGKADVHLTPFAISRPQLAHLLYIYRHRYKTRV